MESHENHPSRRAGIFRRFFHWLFSWRTIRRALIALVGVVTLIAVFWTEENWRGKHEWEKYKREWGAKGERFDFADFVPKPIPDEENFFKAAIWEPTFDGEWDPKTGDWKRRNTNVVDVLEMTVYAQPGPKPPQRGGDWEKGTLTDLKVWQEYYRKAAGFTNFFAVPSQPQTPAADVLLALSRYNSAIESLRKASERPGSRPPLDYSNPLATASAQLPFFREMKGCIQVLQLRAISELSAGENAAAFEDVKLMLRLTDSLQKQPTLIAQLVTMALWNFAIQPIYEGIARHQWNDAQLVELDSELSRFDFLANYEFIMRGERAFSIAMIGYIQQQYRLNPFYPRYRLANAQMFQRWILPAADLKQRTMSPRKTRDLQKSEATEWKKTTLYNMLAKINFSALSKAQVRFAKSQSSVDLTRTACTLERYRLKHGNYPESLDALAPQFMTKLPHDIINGEPLRYHRADGNHYTLYSIGWDEKDDNGTVAKKKPGRMELEKGDWVWQIPAK